MNRPNNSSSWSEQANLIGLNRREMDRDGEYENDQDKCMEMDFRSLSRRFVLRDTKKEIVRNENNAENEEEEGCEEEDDEDDDEEDEEDADAEGNHENELKKDMKNILAERQCEEDQLDKSNEIKAEIRSITGGRDYHNTRRLHLGIDGDDLDMVDHTLKRDLGGIEHYTAAVAAAAGMIHHHIHSGIEHIRSATGNVDMEMKLSRDSRSSCLGLGLSLELCVVCGDRASGRHYGAISCEGCKGFFKRSIRKQLGYQCRGTKSCEVTKHHRNRCQYCRLQKCLTKGMRSDSVQHERKPVLGGGDSASSAVTGGKNNNRGTRVKPESLQATSIVDTSSTPSVWEQQQQQPLPQSDSPGMDDQQSSDSDLSEALNLTRERLLINHALDNMVKLIASDNVNGSSGDGEPEEDWNCGQLLFERNTLFELRAPSPAPAYLSIHYICESAARLLFLSVHWARSIPSFQTLPSEVQITLVRSSWGQLFTLGLAQCAYTLSLPSILTWIINQLQTSITQEKITASKMKSLTEHICRLHECVSTLHKLQVDSVEYAYLKALTLFSADNVLAGVWRKRVQILQEAASTELQQRVGSERLPKLLLRLAPLHSINPRVLEDLFFAGLIGRVSVTSVVPYILSMQDCYKMEPENQMRG